LTTVRDIMSTQLVTVEPSANLTEAVHAMSAGRSGSVLVLQAGSLVGIFTERDILRALAHSAKADLARVSSVTQWMSPDPETIEPDTTVAEALNQMLFGGFRHLPVMDEDAVVGMVSMRDLGTVALVALAPVGETGAMRSHRYLRPCPAPRSAFTGYRFAPEVITLAVRWYLRFGLSYRDVEELLAERGIEVDHVSIYRWVQRFAPEFAEAARARQHVVGDHWHVDETYVKVGGIWRYLFRAIDQFGQVIDVYFSPRRDAKAARRFFARSIDRTRISPVEVTTDRYRAYPRIIDDLLPAAFHDTEVHANNPLETDHGRLKARLRPMRGLRHCCIGSRRGHQGDSHDEITPASSCPTSAVLGLRRVSLPARGHHPGGPVVPAVRSLLSRRRGAPGRARHRGRSREHLPVGPAVRAGVRGGGTGSTARHRGSLACR
jgi:transposase-like protein/CBS domain-containing protein